MNNVIRTSITLFFLIALSSCDSEEERLIKSLKNSPIRPAVVDEILAASTDKKAEQSQIVIYKTSFDCAKASTDVENLICTTEDLAEYDQKMADLYKKVSKDPSVKEEQRKWIKERNACKSDVDCLRDQYKFRIRDFTKASEQGAAFAGKWDYTNCSGDLEIKNCSGKQCGFAIETVCGSSFSSCSVEGKLTLQSNKTANSVKNGCTISFQVNEKGNLVVKNKGDKCSYDCGARAYYDGEYKRK
ncbi:hypothetical protein AGMMS49938_17320 [Fibrobacterales bacterium]|nr:hypothetical protein AGMMS49938_17320 [Fibrobacterales bacterium]